MFKTKLQRLLLLSAGQGKVYCSQVIMLDVLEACAKISASELDEMGPSFMEMGEKKPDLVTSDMRLRGNKGVKN